MSTYWIRMDETLLEESGLEASEVVFPKGSSLLESGDPLKYVYLIKEGRVRLETLDDKGDFRILYIVCEGAMIGDEFAGGERTDHFYVRARTEVKARAILIEDFKVALKENIQLANYLIELQYRKNQILVEELYRMSFGDALIRVSSALQMIMTDFGSSEQGGIQLNMEFTHQDLADLIGLTRVSVSNVLKSLQNWGIITKAGKGYRVVRPELLSDFTG